MTTNLPTEQTPLADALLRAGEEMGPAGFGRLMKFSKGRYFVDDEEIAPSREFIAHVGSFARGYVRFADGKLTDQRIVRVTDGPEPNRTDLGDTDATKWARDSKGEPQDPWSRQVYLPIEDMQSGEVFVFVSGSQGGRGAIGALCTLAGRNVHRGMPVIRLSVSSYKHNTFGRIDKPELKVSAWTADSASGRTKPTVQEDLNDDVPF